MAYPTADWAIPVMPDWTLTWFSDLSIQVMRAYKDVWTAIKDITGKITTVNHWVQGIQTQGNTNTARIRDLEA